MHHVTTSRIMHISSLFTMIIVAQSPMNVMCQLLLSAESSLLSPLSSSSSSSSSSVLRDLDLTGRRGTMSPWLRRTWRIFCLRCRSSTDVSLTIGCCCCWRLSGPPPTPPRAPPRLPLASNEPADADWPGWGSGTDVTNGGTGSTERKANGLLWKRNKQTHTSVACRR